MSRFNTFLAHYLCYIVRSTLNYDNFVTGTLFCLNLGRGLMIATMIIMVCLVQNGKNTDE